MHQISRDIPFLFFVDVSADISSPELEPLLISTSNVIGSFDNNSYTSTTMDGNVADLIFYNCLSPDFGIVLTDNSNFTHYPVKALMSSPCVYHP